jgi:hypothetical protein
MVSLDTAASPREGPDANSPGLDHNQIAEELVGMDRNDIGYYVGFCRIRQAIQCQQDHAANREVLTNDQFAEIVILGDEDAALDLRRLKYVLISVPSPRFADRRNIESADSKPFDDVT